jgi:hypothetical protein
MILRIVGLEGYLLAGSLRIRLAYLCLAETWRQDYWVSNVSRGDLLTVSIYLRVSKYKSFVPKWLGGNENG